MNKTRLSRIIPAVGFAVSIGLFAVGTAVVPTTADAADANACTTKKFEFKSVEDACKAGGRKAAKKLMKTAVKSARKKGKKMTCLACHKDLKKFERKDNAVKDLKPYLK